MNLRNRSLLLLSLIFFTLFILIAAVSFNVTLSGLERIEYQRMNEALDQSRSALDGESQVLLSTAQDWSWWDEMDHFAVYHNQDFINRNANPENMATVRLHLFMIMDDQGNLLYGRTLSSDFQQNAPVSDEITSIVRANPILINHTMEDPGSAGILLLPDGPMLFATSPILPSDKNGPVHGTIIMGRYLQFGTLQRIKTITSYDLNIHWKGEPGLGAEQAKVLDQLSTTTNPVMGANNETIITGYAPIRDLAGRNLFMELSMNRELYRIGLANIFTYLSLLALWAVMTGLIVVIVMDRTVLHRIDLLTKRVRALADSPEETPVPILSGNDELAALEQGILASRADLLMSERQLRAFINALSDPAALYSQDGRILLANTAFAAYLQKYPEDLAGTDVRSQFPSEEIQKHIQYFETAKKTRAMVQFESESGGKTLLVSYYPVTDSAGSVVQLGLLTFDISERKRLENALQTVTKKIALLNTVIFNDIQNKIFVQAGYQELSRKLATDPRQREFLEKEEEAVKEIQDSLEFARQYNDMGINPPRWQNVMEVLVFAVSHIDLGSLSRDFHLGGLEIFADSLLERVFLSLAENIILHAKGATTIRAGYILTEDGVVIFLEDDGPGVPAGNKELIFNKGAGTSGAVSLFLSREILSVTGITIRETGIPDQGARFEMLIPKGSYRLKDQ